MIDEALRADERYRNNPEQAPPGWEPLLPEKIALEEDPKMPDLPNIRRLLDPNPIKIMGDKEAADENKVRLISIKAVKLTYIFPGYIPS